MAAGNAQAATARNAFVGTVGVNAIAGALTECATALGIVILLPGELSQLVGVEEQIAKLRIERHPAPVHAPMIAGELRAQEFNKPPGTRPAH